MGILGTGYPWRRGEDSDSQSRLRVILIVILILMDKENEKFFDKYLLVGKPELPEIGHFGLSLL